METKTDTGDYQRPCYSSLRYLGNARSIRNHREVGYQIAEKPVNRKENP